MLLMGSRALYMLSSALPHLFIVCVMWVPRLELESFGLAAFTLQVFPQALHSSDAGSVFKGL